MRSQTGSGENTQYNNGRHTQISVDDAIILPRPSLPFLLASLTLQPTTLFPAIFKIAFLFLVAFFFSLQI